MMTENLHKSPASEEKKTVYYSKIEIDPCVDDPQRLIFVAADGSPPLPKEIVQLRDEFIQIAALSRNLFWKNPSAKKKIFLILHRAADRGLRGVNFDIRDGWTNADTVKREIESLFTEVRSLFFKRYLFYVFSVGLPFFVLGAMIWFSLQLGWLDGFSFGRVSTEDAVCWIIAFFWIPAGAAICLWIEFALRTYDVLKYEQLAGLDPGRWLPWERLAIVVGVSFVFAFFLAIGAVQFGLGGISLNDFYKDQPMLSLAVGGISAIAFSSIREIIYRIRPIEPK